MLGTRVGGTVGRYGVMWSLAKSGMAHTFVAQLARLEGPQFVVLRIVSMEDEGRRGTGG